MAEAKGSKRAAIDFEEIADTPLKELSADRFLEALSRENLLPYLPLWVEYELPWGGLGDGRPQPMPFDPARYEGLVSRLADELEGRLRSRLGR